MAETTLLIDARARGPHGPFAAENVLGATVLDQLVSMALSVQSPPVIVHARAEEIEILGGLLSDPRRGSCRFVTGPPPAGSPLLRTDRLYHPSRLRHAIRRGRDPETAVLWRLDTPHGLQGAEDELARRRHYQPLGRFWALGLARMLATRLSSTRIRPNHLTITAGLLMLSAAALIAMASASSVAGPIAAALMALALVLDTADGHLARLQGTASPFGRWLDANLDELADMALHAAVAWSLFAPSRNPAWLLLGMAYGMGKYLFLVGQHTWIGSESAPAPAPAPSSGVPSLAELSLSRRISHWIGHADLRWHAWIVLAVLGCLKWELILFSLYFPLRALAGACRKGRSHA